MKITLTSSKTKEVIELEGDRIFLSSDHHLRHFNVLKFEDRPYANLDEMDEDLISKHNSVVTNNDIWLCLGDFVWSKKADGGGTDGLLRLCPQFNAKNKVLFLGNHDDMKLKDYFDAGFEYVFDKDDIVWMRSSNFKGVIRVNHRPPFNEKIEKDKDVDFSPMMFDKSSPINICSTIIKQKCICGHVHRLFKRYKNGPVINVSTDAWDGYPVNINEILRYLYS